MTLLSKTILLTRPQEQSEESRKIFEDFGATVLIQPTIEILPPDDWNPVDQIIQTLFLFDWIIFSSSNGVHSFFQRIQTHLNSNNPSLLIKQNQSDKMPFDNFDNQITLKQTDSLNDFWKKFSIKIAALGPGTAAAIENYGLSVDLVPLKYSAEGMIAAFQKEIPKENQRGIKILSIRASRGRNVLRNGLTEIGATVQEIVVYRSVDLSVPNPQIVQFLNDQKIDAVIITSSAIAKSLIKMFGEALKQTALVSISPITSQIVRENGLNLAFESENASLKDIADLLEKEL